MFKKLSFLLAIPAILLIFSGISMSATLDLTGWTDITIFDGLTGSGSWYSNTNEDNEVEYGIDANGDLVATTQDYDLEGIFYNFVTNELAIVGGYDFLNGNNEYLGGDIFLNTRVTSYVLDIEYYYYNGTSIPTPYMEYQVYTGAFGTDPTSVVLAAGPWKRNTGGTLLDYNTYTIDYYDVPYANDNIIGVNYIGYDTDGRYALVANLGWLGSDIFDVSYTMECGNDLIRGSAVPEPSTLLLFGAGLLGLGSYIRKMSTK